MNVYLNRRGMALLFFALVFIVIGESYTDGPVTNYQAAILSIITGVMPLWMWGYVWIGVGVACVVGAIWRNAQPAAYGLCMFLCCMWGLGYLAAAIFVPDVPRAYSGGVTWIALAGFLQLLATWPDNERRR